MKKYDCTRLKLPTKEEQEKLKEWRKLVKRRMKPTVDLRSASNTQNEEEMSNSCEKYYYKDLKTAKKCSQCRWLWCRYAIMCTFVSDAVNEMMRKYRKDKFGDLQFAWSGQGEKRFWNLIDMKTREVIHEDVLSNLDLTQDCPYLDDDCSKCMYYKSWDDWTKEWKSAHNRSKDKT